MITIFCQPGLFKETSWIVYFYAKDNSVLANFMYANPPMKLVDMYYLFPN